MLCVKPCVVKNSIFSHVLVSLRVVVKRRIVNRCILSHAVTSFVLWSRPSVFGRGVIGLKIAGASFGTVLGAARSQKHHF